MKALVYAGNALRTGDEIAQVVMEYAASLAGASRADTVVIPVRTASGALGAATLLLGPASQIVAEDAPDELEEIEDAAVVADLRDRARAIDSPSTAVVDGEPPGVAEPDEFGL